MILLEACLDTPELAVAAEQGGAGRIELCDRLEVGGTTPSDELIRSVVAAVRIPVFAIVRARGGDFTYTLAEMEIMRRDAARMRGLGAAGIVFGALTSAGAVDGGANRSVIEAAGGLPCTFHLAFERAKDRGAALEELIALGFRRVLTRGGGKTALDGVEGLRRLVEQAAGRIGILAGGNVREDNVAEIVRRSGVREVHSRGLRVAEMVRRANDEVKR